MEFGKYQFCQIIAEVIGFANICGAMYMYSLTFNNNWDHIFSFVDLKLKLYNNNDPIFNLFKKSWATFCAGTKKKKHSELIGLLHVPTHKTPV